MEHNHENSVEIIKKLRAESEKATYKGTCSAIGALTAALAASLIPGVGVLAAASIAALGIGVTSVSLSKKIREDKLSLDIENMLSTYDKSTAVIEAINEKTSKYKADEFDLDKMRRTIDELKANGLIVDKNRRI